MVPAMTSSKSRSARDPQASTSFTSTENKSLEGEVTEAKSLVGTDGETTDATAPVRPSDNAAGGATENPAEAQAAPNMVSVTMRHHFSYDGKDLLPRRSYSLPRSVAQVLVGTDRAVYDGEG